MTNESRVSIDGKKSDTDRLVEFARAQNLLEHDLMFDGASSRGAPAALAVTPRPLDRRI
jgi:hypothetical protein